MPVLPCERLNASVPPVGMRSRPGLAPHRRKHSASPITSGYAGAPMRGFTYPPLPIRSPLANLAWGCLSLSRKDAVIAHPSKGTTQ